MAAELRPVPEFAAFAAHVPDIIRPKPRRLSDVRQHQASAVIVVGTDRLIVPASQLRAPGDGAAPASPASTSGSSQQFPELNCADLENDVFRDEQNTAIIDCTPLRAQRPLQRNLAGGSAPALHRPRPRSTSRPRPHTPHAAVTAVDSNSSRSSAEGQLTQSATDRSNNLVTNREKFSGLDVLDGCSNVSEMKNVSYENGKQESSICDDLEVYDIDAANILANDERRYSAVNRKSKRKINNFQLFLMYKTR